MDYKKVGDIIPTYLGVPFIFESDGITPQVFDAEFQDARINGNINGTKGWFNGSLSAGAIDVIDNIHVLGGSVCTTQSAFYGPVTVAVSDPSIGSTAVRQHTFVSYSFTVPSDAGGFMLAHVDMEDGGLWDEGGNWYIQIDGGTSYYLTVHNDYVSGRHRSMSCGVITTPGTHTVRLFYSCRNDLFVVKYVQIYGCDIIVDYFHKL